MMLLSHLRDHFRHMNRRKFLNTAAPAGLAAAASAPLGAASAANAIFELRYFRMRNGPQVQRTSEFLGKHYLPAAQRAGLGPLGFFSGVIAGESPFVLQLASYPSLEAVGSAADKIVSDKEFQKGFDEYNAELSYIRMENSLLRAFDVQPSLKPPRPPEKGTHIFELRTYESPGVKASRRKIQMFNDGEAAIFQRLGMQPVFFGETLVGRNLPNLTYMLTFDDLAGREKLWSAFGRDPEWQKMRAIPELADALIVSNISNAILRPLPFSQIR